MAPSSVHPFVGARTSLGFMVGCLVAFAACAEDLTEEKADIAQLRSFATANVLTVETPCR